MDWFYTNGRSKHGPIDEEGIRLRAQKGYIRSDTLLWNETMRDWKTAGELGFFPDDDVEPTMCVALPSAQPPPIPASSARQAVPEATFRMDAGASRPAMREKRAMPPSAMPEPSLAMQEPQPAYTRAPDPAASSVARDPAPNAAPPQAPIQVNAAAPAAASGEVSVSNWFWTMFLMAIPLVNIILVLVWAFDGSTTQSKANWAKAILLWILVGIIISVLFWGTIISALSR